LGQVNFELRDREFTSRVGAYFGAVREGTERVWRETEGITHGSDADVITDLLMICSNDRERSICECERCGRLYVQVAPYQNRYLACAPEEQK
jgi:hypothetical protein